MTANTKRISLLFLVGTLVSLILLSASLSNMQLQTAAPFPGASGSGSEIQFFTNLTLVNPHSFTIQKGIFAIIFLMLMIYVPIRYIALVKMKRLTQLLFVMAASLFIIIMISQITPFESSYQPDESTDIATPPSFNYPVSPLGEPPQGLIKVVLVVFIFGVGLLALRIFKPWLYPIQIKEQLLQEAEIAVNAIKTGENLHNAIIRCYLQMTNTLREERKIERTHNMTAREFEGWLEDKGFPTFPVHQLTHLFEKARYGTQLTLKEDEKMAIESLNEIIQFCRNERN